MSVSTPAAPLDARGHFSRMTRMRVRRAGLVWLTIVGAWVAPALIVSASDSTPATVTAGWVGPTTLLLVLVAVVASVSWGAILEANHQRGLMVPSIVLGSVVVLAWCQALALAWIRDAPDVNPEAVMVILGTLVAVSSVVIAAAVAVGWSLSARP